MCRKQKEPLWCYTVSFHSETRHWGNFSGKKLSPLHSWFMLKGFLKSSQHCMCKVSLEIPSFSNFLSSETKPKHLQVLSTVLVLSKGSVAFYPFPISHTRLGQYKGCEWIAGYPLSITLTGSGLPVNSSLVPQQPVLAAHSTQLALGARSQPCMGLGVGSPPQIPLRWLHIGLT